MIKLKIINILALIFGLTSSLTLLVIFYVMLNQNYIILLTANHFNEFWIEFLMIHVFILIILIALIYSLKLEKK